MGRWGYLVHLLAWTAPLLAGQLWMLRRRYGADTGRVLRAILPPAIVVSLWLAAADHLAIRDGIWRFGPGRHLGITVGVVPVEEILFFLVTNLLVAFGLALMEGFGRRRTA
jgi:lycopene cyclase domain-containing protein